MRYKKPLNRRRNNWFDMPKFTPKNLEKYEGNHTNINIRSSWELACFKWCDRNPDVIKWSSEEFYIPYFCKTESNKLKRKSHPYYVDLKIKFKCGKTALIEIKPKNQVSPPEKKKRTTQKYLKSILIYAKDVSKWEAANKYANERGWIFQIWTEDTLKAMGLKVYINGR